MAMAMLASKHVQLKYRNSFIDVEESDQEEEPSDRKGRASSAPPLAPRASTMTTAMHEEANMHRYVCHLSSAINKLQSCGYGENSTASTADEDGASPVSSASADSVARVGPGPEPAAQDESYLAPSRGSLGHPELCRRPCIYVAVGHCENGSACSFCHMPHEEKAPKLDKRQRGILQNLSRRDLLALVLQSCQPKARLLGPAVHEILSLLEAEAANGPLPAWINERDARNLQKTLRRMNFSNLIGLVTHQAPSRGLALESAQLIADALEKLRHFSEHTFSSSLSTGVGHFPGCFPGHVPPNWLNLSNPVTWSFYSFGVSLIPIFGKGGKALEAEKPFVIICGDHCRQQRSSWL
ncbi:unnamed protein product [Effrenium voratum]|nr:unnamed protein product [Effrenium voratum]